MYLKCNDYYIFLIKIIIIVDIQILYYGLKIGLAIIYLIKSINKK